MSTPTISTHVASPAEQREAFLSSHAIWGRGRSLEAYLEARESSPRMKRATIWVLTVDGAVASSLACYPLRFRLDGREVVGFGLGSVGTPEVYRRRGYAERLCRAAMGDARATHGAAVGLLFSDIPPAYYGKMGFRPCPSVTRTAHAALPDGPRALLSPLTAPAAAAPELTAWHRAEHADDRLCIWRDEAYSRYLVEADPDDRYFTVHRSEGAPAAGHVRAYIDDGLVYPVEIALAEPGDAALRAATWRALAAMAGERTLRSWLTPPPPLDHAFTPTPREKSLVMIRLDPSLGLSEADAAAAAAGFRVSVGDYF